MKDQRVDKLAELLVNYSVEVKPGDKVFLRGDALAEPLFEAVYVKVLQAGGLPLVIPQLPGLDELFYKNASTQQLEYVPDLIKQVFETYDVEITLDAQANTQALNNVDPQKMVLHRRAKEGIMRTFMERSAKKELRWVVTLFPTQAHAQNADMSLSEYEDFVYNACMPDFADPVGYWKGVSAQQQKIVDWLAGKRQVHVIGAETDLKLNIEGRTFENCDCKANVPDGEIFTGPVEDSVEGHVYFSYPAIFSGREVTGVHLWFKEGRVVKATAEKNEEFLLKTLDIDEGSRRVGEFAIGTNKGITQFTREILFDEKIAGSFHLALGAGYPETGSKNQSSLHWDMICDLRQGGEIWVDDQLLYKNGEFTLDL